MPSIGTFHFPEGYYGDTYKAVAFVMRLNGVVVNLTGATIRIQFRAYSTGDPTILKTLSIGSGITVTDAVNGAFRTDAYIMNLIPGIYEYDIEITYASGYVKTYARGTLSVTGDITRGAES